MEGVLDQKVRREQTRYGTCCEWPGDSFIAGLVSLGATNAYLALELRGVGRLCHFGFGAILSSCLFLSYLLM